MSTTYPVDTVVVGAGHAGLAVSRLLTEARREHVVLERGGVSERWRSGRWDSLHLLTPSWMTRLPGWSYTGPNHEGFLSAGQLVDHLERYAASFDAPVVTGVRVDRLRRLHDGRFELRTDSGRWLARQVVVATGPHGIPHVPTALARSAASAGVEVVTSSDYRNPGRLAPGGVLVVGASASGVQIADELHRAGRDVVLAVGRHTRMPRRYRGMDICWWLSVTGRLARTVDDVRDPQAARTEPSLQLVGGPSGAGGRSLDLDTLQQQGVRLTGRLRDLSDGVARSAPDLPMSVAAAQHRMDHFLDAVDQYVDRAGLGREVWSPDRPRSFVPEHGPARISLRSEGIGTVLFATGYRPELSWIDLPVVDEDGQLRQYRGVTEVPGLYSVGQRFQHRRDSSFIDGARHDARAVVNHITTGDLDRDGVPFLDEEAA